MIGIAGIHEMPRHKRRRKKEEVSTHKAYRVTRLIRKKNYSDRVKRKSVSSVMKWYLKRWPPTLRKKRKENRKKKGDRAESVG